MSAIPGHNKRDRRVSWNHLWEMYRWERRHGYRSYGYRYDYPVDAYRSDRRSKGKAKNKRH